MQPFAAGPELDRRIQREVLRTIPGDLVPPYSEEDRSATALAHHICRETGWRLEITELRGTWSVTWAEGEEADLAGLSPQRIGALVTASASTRPLAICRALLKAARSPRWPAFRAGCRTPVRRARSLAI